MTTKIAKITKKMQAEMEATYYAYLVKRTADYVLAKNPTYRFEIKRTNIANRMRLSILDNSALRKALKESPYSFKVTRNKYPTPHIERGFLKMILDVHEIMKDQGRFLEQEITDDDFLLVEMMKF
jgi:hypothetical protein